LGQVEFLFPKANAGDKFWDMWELRRGLVELGCVEELRESSRGENPNILAPFGGLQQRFFRMAVFCS